MRTCMKRRMWKNHQSDRAGYYGDQFDTAPNHRIYQHIKKLNAIRKAVPALQKGSYTWGGTSQR